MSLNWNEVRLRAKTFATEFADASYEKGETQTFYNAFFDVFGIKRRQVARYEDHVKKLNDKSGFMDLFWPRVLLIEQKSAGRDLAKAADQAGEYFDAIKDSEKPRFQLVSDFQNFQLLDRDSRETWSFTLGDLPEKVELFAFMLGREKRKFTEQDPVNIEASEIMGAIHDELEASGYTGHKLEVFLVRLLFMLFADDTGIFQPRDLMLDVLEAKTREDGSDLGQVLQRIYQVLNTPEDKRGKNIDEDFNRFPYVNGDLFSETIEMADFNSSLRERLLNAARFNWQAVSPAIFGSLFQSVMKADERRKKGAHYTSETNILKLIGPLFLDELRSEFEKLKALKIGKTGRLEAFRKRLGTLTFLDPACGCGNFLIVAYREMRQLELEVMEQLNTDGQLDIMAATLSVIDVDQFYGIELEEFPARIAEVAMWMIDHIMNNKMSLAFGQIYTRIPLKKSPHILSDMDALEVDWNTLLSADKCSYIFGNPPFIGHQQRDKKQQQGMHLVWGNAGQVNRLDYVTAWFRKAIEYSKRGSVEEIAFVSTNSICQGEQASILWPWIRSQGYQTKFAHRTFQWNSEARGAAAVHCIIIGLSRKTVESARVFDYSHVRGEPNESCVGRLNNFLVDGSDRALPARGQPPVGRLKLGKGSQPTDGARIKNPNGGYTTRSNLILDSTERDRVLALEPSLVELMRPYVGSDDMISGEWRWCFWLLGISPNRIAQSAELRERLLRVTSGRLLSPTPNVRDYWSKYPTLFSQNRQPDVKYLAVPEVSSETREYIPIQFFDPDVIASNKLQIIPDASPLYFSILNSTMHMGRMRTVTGRLKNDYSYSPTVYNTFPWPVMTPADEARIGALGQAVLDARAEHVGSTLADLYDPDLMPPNLRKAHQTLDKAVDKLYRKEGFASERERVEHLFMLYEKLVAPLEAAANAKVKKVRKKAPT